MIRSRDDLATHLNRGGLVRLELRHEPEFKRIWSVPQTGEPVHGSAARWALDAGKIKPLHDGLFEDAPAQTYEAV